MQIKIIYNIDFQDRESVENLEEIIHEGIEKNIIPSAEEIRERMPVTAIVVERFIEINKTIIEDYTDND